MAELATKQKRVLAGKSAAVGNKTKGSKYNKKRKGRKPAAKPVRRGEPVFLYYVQGTDVLATKVPCEKNPEATAAKPSQSPLGTWRDPRTGRKCKVTRVRNKPEVTEESNEATAQT